MIGGGFTGGPPEARYTIGPCGYYGWDTPEKMDLFIQSHWRDQGAPADPKTRFHKACGRWEILSRVKMYRPPLTESEKQLRRQLDAAAHRAWKREGSSKKGAA